VVGVNALTIWQPHAALFVAGVRNIETRSWSTKYRGPLAIHAAQRLPDGIPAKHEGGSFVLDGHVYVGRSGSGLFWYPVNPSPTVAQRSPSKLTLGAVVATCELVDVLPIRDYSSDKTTSRYILNEVGGLGRRVLGIYEPGGLGISHGNGNGDDHPWVAANRDIDAMTAQLPYGDFRPGRWAWLLADIKPLDEPVPAKGKQGIWEWDASALAIAEGVTA